MINQYVVTHRGYLATVPQHGLSTMHNQCTSRRELLGVCSGDKRKWYYTRDIHV
jgi:hypothetical protein